MDAASRVRPILHEVTCQEWGLLGTGARAAPQEPGTKTAVETKKTGEQRVGGNKCKQNGKRIKQKDSGAGGEWENFASHKVERKQVSNFSVNSQQNTGEAL